LLKFHICRPRRALFFVGNVTRPSRKRCPGPPAIFFLRMFRIGQNHSVEAGNRDFDRPGRRCEILGAGIRPWFWYERAPFQNIPFLFGGLALAPSPFGFCPIHAAGGRNLERSLSYACWTRSMFIITKAIARALKAAQAAVFHRPNRRAHARPTRGPDYRTPNEIGSVRGMAKTKKNHSLAPVTERASPLPNRDGRFSRGLPFLSEPPPARRHQLLGPK